MLRDHLGRWVGFRQPIKQVVVEKLGPSDEDISDANPVGLCEENEFWFHLSWRIYPDSPMGIRRLFDSRYRSREKVTVDECYRWIFTIYLAMPACARRSR